MGGFFGFEEIRWYHQKSESKEGAYEEMKKKKEVISAQRVLEELAAIGFARATDLVGVEDDRLVLKDPKEKNASAAIAGIERTSGGVKVKFYDKMQALELLGKLLGMFDGKLVQNESQDNNLLEILLQNTREAIQTDDIQELQQTAADCDDLVEPTSDAML